MKDFLLNEVKGWKKWEVVWLLLACMVIAGLSIYWGDSLMGVLSATTGVACVVCTGKGKLSAYVFGLVNCILYAIIAFEAALYGETMLNIIYYVPMQFVGFFVWKKHMNKETQEVIKKHMSWRGRLGTIILIMLATVAYAVVLVKLGDALPWVDSFTTIASVAAMLVSVRMFAEQWWIWVAVDIFSVYMWWCDFRNGSDNMATLLMWVVYLGNALIMLIKWEKEVRRQKL